MSSSGYNTLGPSAPPPVYGASWVVQVQTSGSVPGICRCHHVIVPDQPLPVGGHAWSRQDVGRDHGPQRRDHPPERDGHLGLPAPTLPGVRPPLVERSTMTITAPLFTDLDLSDPDEMMKVTNNGKTPIRVDRGQPQAIQHRPR